MKKPFIATAMVLAFLVVNSGQCLAQEICGCVNNRDGKLRIVDCTSGKCSKKETTISWNQEGPQGPQGEPGPPGPEGPAGQGATRVYDSNGNFLGTLLNLVPENDQLFNVSEPMPGNLTFFVPAADKLFRCILNPSGKKGKNLYDPLFMWSGDPYAYFESNDCTGTPYLYHPNPDDRHPATTYYIVTIEQQGFEVYNHYTMTYGPIFITAQSKKRIGNPDCEPCSQAFDDLMFELTEIVLPFEYPIALPVRFE